MISIIRSIGFVACVGLAALGCGGGGGDGGSGSRGVRILHAGIDSAPFLLTTSAAEGTVLQTAKFSLPDQYFALPSGEQIVNAVSASGNPNFSFSMPKDRPARQSILVFGSRSHSGAKAALLVDEAGEITKGMSALRVVHGVERLGTIEASAAAVAVGQGVALGSASTYVMVPAGAQQVIVKASGQGATLFNGTVDLQAGQAYSLWAVGEYNYFTVVRLVQD